jgi:hypothetical protein
MSDKVTISNFVNGEKVAARDGATYDVIDPSTGEVYATAPMSGQEDVDAAFKAAEKGFETWRDATPAERQRALLKLADAMEERADELVAIESRDTASRSASPTPRRSRPRWTRSGSSPGRPATWRAGLPVSTSPATRPLSVASPSASSHRSRHGTTR